MPSLAAVARRAAASCIVASMVAGAAAAQAADSPLVGTSWIAEDIGGKGVIDTAQTTLTFDAADKAAGSGGCNRFIGGITMSDTALSFTKLGATRMACPPAVMEQEQRFFEALQAVASYEVRDDGLLYLLGDDKTVQVRLSKDEDIAVSEEFAADILTLVEKTGTLHLDERLADQLITPIIQSIQAANQNVPSELLTLFEEEMRAEMKRENEQLANETIQIFARHFSPEDVKGLIAFYDSDLGRKMIKSMPPAVRESVAAARQWSVKRGEIAFDKALERYQALHPPAEEAPAAEEAPVDTPPATEEAPTDAPAEKKAE